MDFHVLGFGLVNYGWKVMSLYNTKFDNDTILQEPIRVSIFCLLFAICYHPGIIKVLHMCKDIKIK